jgi:predicted RNase H-like nuclease (RuvC/YqgF family)
MGKKTDMIKALEQKVKELEQRNKFLESNTTEMIEKYEKVNNQLKKVEQLYNFYNKNTNEFIQCTGKKEIRDQKIQLFLLHINDLMNPKNAIEILLRNFYFYLLEYLDIERIKQHYEKTSKR